MTDEKKAEEDEVTDEQLEDVAGGLGLNVSSIKEKAPPQPISGTPTGVPEGDLGDCYFLSQLAAQQTQDPDDL